MDINIDYSDIKPTAKGFRVEKKIAGQPRLRKTFSTHEEAVTALSLYMKGEAEKVVNVTSDAVTWKVLYDLTVKKQWRLNKTTASQDTAARVIENYLGWSTDSRTFDQDMCDKLSDALEADIPKLVTVSKHLSAVRVMLDWGQKQGMVSWKLPVIPHYGQTATRINYFDYEDEQKIVNIMKQTGREEYADLFTVLIETGMRTAEGMYLQWRDVDLESGIIRIWADSTKTSKSRRVPITPIAVRVLKERKEARVAGEPRVFPSATKSTMRTTWHCVRAGMNNYDKDFVWYTTRHTCASRLIRCGIDIKTVQAWLGHARIETTMRYVQFSSGSLINAADALDEARGGFVNQVDTADTRLAS